MINLFSIANPLSATGHLYEPTKSLHGFGLRPGLAEFFAKQLQSWWNQRLKHYRR